MTSITPIFTGRVIQLNIERVELPNGSTADLEIIHHPGGAAVVAVDDANRVCLLRQYRHAANGWLWELPAGKIDNRESPAYTAVRELEEEAGVRAEQWDELGGYISSPGVFTEVVHLFLARGLRAVPAAHEQHEVIEVHWLAFEQALRMAYDGEINDGKSLVGLFRAAPRL
jgi:ADP-ribose pyrophosphatase